MRLKIYSPEGLVFDKSVSIVTFKTIEGEMGVLRNRAPIIGKLKIDKIITKTDDNETFEYMINDGFVHCDGENVIIVTEDARLPEEIDPHHFMGK
ncbi:F0F1 ATP synthase subunit epsilon [Thermosipho ferrireducens]|uniref:F0F1 ATP synthase subunit epsilon n=1 Tax=Thermosipho ferrireducens TaxID=2571116 RepID=A0ABX7S424_9BACT|nr:F0F1 ATP synthase subunit epsilon [Thermosipho ferrireducens]QTA37168.1 F0F1 ATP synthase subunit epsilon [Thermosipho ferrireducens]